MYSKIKHLTKYRGQLFNGSFANMVGKNSLNSIPKSKEADMADSAKGKEPGESKSKDTLNDGKQEKDSSGRLKQENGKKQMERFADDVKPQNCYKENNKIKFEEK
jgi:hypothetical protein